MKNNFIRVIGLVLALIMCLSATALVACEKEPSPEPPVSSGDASSDDTPAESTNPAEPEKATISVESLNNYYVVRPDVNNEELVASVMAFEKNLEAKLSVETKGITTDFVLPGNDLYSVHDYEIIIGETNREESIAFASELEYMEYGYAVIGNKIVISGRSIADTILAIDKFTADIIDGYTSGSTELVFENNKYICEYDHKFDSISINGTDISEYDIVYKKTKAFHENEIVERLQDSIGRLCGFMPKGILMNTTSNIKTKQIVITDSPALTDEIKANKNALLSGVDVASKSVIVVDENVIWLSGETLAGLLDTVEKFVSALESSADGKVTLESGVSDISNPAIKVMSYNVYVSAATAGIRRKGVAKTIFDYAPDIIGVQEASVGWMTMLKADIGSVYDSVGKGRESMNNNPSSRTNGEHCAIFYNKEKYKVLETNTFWLSETPNVQSKHDESEYIRIMTYAIFERKSDGFKFMMVNTHLDFKESVKAYQVTKMLEKIEETGFKGLTFITGDFNTNISSGSYKLMLEAGFENTFNAAYISSEPNINSMIDFCMVRDLEGDYIVSNHHVANDEIDKNNNGEFPSDHCAVDASIIPILKKD